MRCTTLRARTAGGMRAGGAAGGRNRTHDLAGEAQGRRRGAWSRRLVLAALIVLGSRNLRHFDAALVGYTFATLFAAFGITYRYAMWLQRPPTRMYWRRGGGRFAGPRLLGRQPLTLGKRFVVEVVATRFIFRRGVDARGRPLADHVGLPDRRRHHLPARLGLGALRDRPRRPRALPHLRLRVRRAATSGSRPSSRSSSSTGWSGRRCWSSRG